MTTEQRQPGESLAAYRGRIRRERNAAVDALKLKDGDPVMYGGKLRRFNSKTMTKANPTYQHTRVLTPSETRQLENDEQGRRERDAELADRVKRREAYEARPEVKAARVVQYAIELEFEKAVECLTPEEWQALAAKMQEAE
jgi:hypothetical protein